MKKALFIFLMCFVALPFGTSAQTTAGLVGHWTFDDGTVAGKIGQAKEFDGVSQYINLGTDATFAFNSSNAFTIAAWVYPVNTTDNPGDIFIRGSSVNAADGTVYYLAQTLDRWTGRVSDGVNIITFNTASGTLVPNTWQHVVMVWNGSTKNIEIYKNGSTLGTKTSSTFTQLWDATMDTYKKTAIGADPRYTPRHHFEGRLDDLRVYNRALTVTEIQEIALLGSGGGSGSTPNDPPTTEPPVVITGCTSVCYIRPDATGNGSGSDWTNAFTTIPATLTRGTTYYIADGNYGAYTFDDAASGSQTITVKKATVAQHGTESGWQASFGDGVALFDKITFTTPYYVLDGQQRGGWDSGYGLKVHNKQSVAGSAGNKAVVISNGVGNITLRYLEVEYLGPTGNRDDGIYAPGNNNFIQIQYSYIHDVATAPVLLHGENNLVEYSKIARNFSTSAIHGDGIQLFARTKDTIIRYNIFEDLSGTASISMAWGTDGIQIYGNIFTQSANYSGGGQGNGQITEISQPGEIGLSRGQIYNNSFVNIKKGLNSGISIKLAASDTNYAYNNLWYNSVKASISGLTHDYNILYATEAAYGTVLGPNEKKLSGDPFVGSTAGDYRLAAALPGVKLSWMNTQDPVGMTRGGDGYWDIGAYEYSGAPEPPVSGPQTYYIDFETGNDANAGTSKFSPWKRHPYMNGFAGSYTHQAGDGFIFKGGVSWPASAMTLYITQGGTSATRDYYGADTSWFKGVSWTKPVFDMAGQELTDTRGTNGNVIWIAASNIDFDSFEVTRQLIKSPLSSAHPHYNAIRVSDAVQNVNIKNVYIHNSVKSADMITDCKCAGIKGGGTPTVVIDNAVIRGPVLPDNKTLGAGIDGQFDVRNSEISGVTQGIWMGGNGKVKNTTIRDGGDSFDPATHENGAWLMGSVEFTGNTMTGWREGVATYLLPGWGARTGNTLTFVNNLYYANSASQINAQADQSPEGSGNKIILINNFTASGLCYNLGGKTGAPIDFIFQNNLCINTRTDSLVPGTLNTSFIKSIVNTNNVTMKLAEANAAGLSASNEYRPTQAVPGVTEAGTSVATYISTDRLGTTRPKGNGWDIGAYEYAGTGTVSVKGDFNNDGIVNSIDFSLMSGAWNTSNAAYDLNKDTTVNTLDYSIMAQNWTR